MKKSIRLTLLFMAFFAFSESAVAQYFTKAPKLNKKVEKIIEWMQLDGKVIKANTSYFNKAGDLVAYHSDEASEKIVLKYDKQGRLTEKYIGQEEAPTEVKYSYKKNTVIWEEHYRGKVFKVFEFRNDKQQLVEKKTFLKGGELGDEYILRERYVYTHNAKDSLQGVMHYIYSLNGPSKGKAFETRKTVVHYHPKHGKRQKVVFYDVNGKIAKQTLYEYQEDGKIKRLIMTINEDEVERTIESKYHADGSLWQEIESTAYKKFVKIYKDNRLIRQRTYIGDELFAIIDFQYVFYK